MEELIVLNIIPRDTAEHICDEIRAEAALQWYTAAARWCWTCQKAAGSDPQRRGFLTKPGNRGQSDARQSRLPPGQSALRPTAPQSAASTWVDLELRLGRTRPYSTLPLQDAFDQLETEVVGAFAFIQCHLDEIQLGFESGDQQVLQGI